MKFCLLLLLQLFHFASFSQSDTATPVLEVITVRAFEQGSRLRDVPAAVNVLDSQALHRFSPASIVQAVNTTAGVRMEERSPGSYRFNIRGSALRSPFGVRNVKVYYNDLPITDPGGQTYLNALGFYNYRTLEIIKGPGSSLYGAGTGGVLAVESISANETPGVEGEFTHGSFGNNQLYIAATVGNKAWKNKFSWQEQRAGGYRNHSALERTVVSWDSRYRAKQGHLLKTTLLYSHLFYNTPGALTLAEYGRNPQAARPVAGAFPSAEAARAAINQRTLIAGVSYSHRLSERFTANILGYGIANRFENPAIRNYGVNVEPHGGARASVHYRRFTTTGRLQLIAGSEWQSGNARIEVYGNRMGNKDTVQTVNRVRMAQVLSFLQADYEWKGWILTAGASLNFFTVRFQRLQPQSVPAQTKRFSNEVAPRISLARRLKAVTLYSSVSKGFSPPTTSELFPSGSPPNLQLSAERGWNYELGFRGALGALDFDVATFTFALQNMVVQRRDAGGGDYYTNAGTTNQRGIETSLGYTPWQSSQSYSQSRIWLSHTWHRFHYRNFKQFATDFSGNKLPGVAPHTLAGGIDVISTKNFFGNVSYFYSAGIPLNDANSAFAEDYQLVNAKIGFERIFATQWKGRLSVGVENLLDARYSLGNDINAFGGRYYNAAPGRSFYISLTVQSSLLQNQSGQ